MNSFLKYNNLSLLWALAILAACLMPGKDLPKLTILDFDKAIHFSIYVILSLLMYYGWKKQSSFISLYQNTFVKILTITSAYGFAVEIMQGLFTTDRHFDLFDALANSMGAVAGSFLAIYLIPKISKT